MRSTTRLAVLSGLALLAPFAHAQVFWDDMCVGTPGDPAASWFIGAYWNTNVVPTASQDVTFGGPCAVDVPTYVLGFGTTGVGGFPNAVMRSLVADSAMTPDPSLSTLSILMGNEPPGFVVPGTFSVGQGAFTLGSRFPSTVGISLNRRVFTHASTTVHTQIATNGASAVLQVSNAPATIGFILRVGRGIDAASGTSSNGSVNVTAAQFPAGLSVANQTQIGTLGGIGSLNLSYGTNNTLTGTVFVGAGTGAASSSLLQSNGTLVIADGFGGVAGATTFGAELLVGNLSGYGAAELYGDVQVGTDAFGTSFVVGRGVTYDASQSQDVRGGGYLNVGGSDGLGFVTSGRGFVAIDGASASFFVPYGGATINGDLVIADLGATTPNGYTPSQGYCSIDLNAGLAVNGNVFVGNNSAIGELVLNPSGDGGASFSANYVGVGTNGTGLFTVSGATTATIDELALQPQTGSQDYRLGGRAGLGTGNPQGCSLSTRLIRASGNGDRFIWEADTLTLRDGRIFDWGNHAFVIPDIGFFYGAGTIETDTINNGQLDVGYYTVFPNVNNDSLIIASNGVRPGNFTQSANASLRLAGSYPTSLFDGNGEETVIIAGNANFGGTLTFDWDGSDYWLNDVQPGDVFNLFDVAGTTTGQFVNIPSNPSHLPPGLPELPFINPSYVDLRWDTTQLYTLGVIRVSGGVTGPVCDSIDFNNDTSFFDPTDVDALLSVFSEGPCIPASATCNDIDFNNDGSLFDPCDIDAFLLVFSEGPCTICGV